MSDPGLVIALVALGLSIIAPATLERRVAVLAARPGAAEEMLAGARP
jgi:hypothetical protein